MEKERPLILLSNDDGVEAKGINELIKALRPIGDLIVVAPNGPRSGSACAITSEHPLCYSKLTEEEGLVIYKCNGTPVDCIKVALHSIVPRTPDLVIGGINHGDNSSVNVHYSGTMGVVIEGCLKKIKSIGFSLCNHAADADFEPLFPATQQIVREVLRNGLPEGTCLNVNFPVAAHFKGIKVCRQTKGIWSGEFVTCAHPRKPNYFWLTGEFINQEPDAEDSDHWALNHGYVAITPVQIDVTAYKLMEDMKQWNLSL